MVSNADIIANEKNEKPNEKKILLDLYYKNMTLPEFPDLMEDMLLNDKNFWSQRTKRHSFVQYLANYYFHETIINGSNQERIGYIYKPVCLKLLSKYENLNAIITNECINQNKKIINGHTKRKRLFQSWVSILKTYFNKIST